MHMHVAEGLGIADEHRQPVAMQQEVRVEAARAGHPRLGAQQPVGEAQADLQRRAADVVDDEPHSLCATVRKRAPVPCRYAFTAPATLCWKGHGAILPAQLPCWRDSAGDVQGAGVSPLFRF